MTGSRPWDREPVLREPAGPRGAAVEEPAGRVAGGLIGRMPGARAGSDPARAKSILSYPKILFVRAALLKWGLSSGPGVPRPAGGGFHQLAHPPGVRRGHRPAGPAGVQPEHLGGHDRHHLVRGPEVAA